MPDFKTPIALSQYFIPVMCSGVLLLAWVLFAYMYARSRQILHLSMFFLSFFGFGFVFSESMVLSVGAFRLEHALGMQFHRVEQLSGAFFIFGASFFIHGIVDLGERWRKVNRVITIAGLVLGFLFFAIAFIGPDLYISQTVHKQGWDFMQSEYGRGQEGPAYMARDALIFLVILYAVACFILDMIRHRRLGYIILPFIGFLLAIHGAVVDIVNIWANHFYLDPFPFSKHSRFTVGITLLILFCTSAVFRKLFDAAHEVTVAEAEASREAGKNLEKITFIRDVVNTGSLALVESMESLSATISAFTLQSQEQAAATEEVSASIEEITAGADNVKANADEQYKNLELLLTTMRNLSGIIVTMNGLVEEALAMIDQISQNARSGEHSLAVMGESMGNIRKSSQEMSGVIEIINDISDKINLLSLNAAIEAARAGEAGRGFAVVADEISKLADQTTSSIKNISELIRTNEKEIAVGNQNVSATVGKINDIIEDIGRIVEKITVISDQMTQQTVANQTVNENAEKVKERSQQITIAMTEQKGAIEEISRTIGSINELSQHNAHQILQITDSTKSIVARVEGMHRDIEDFVERSEAPAEG